MIQEDCVSNKCTGIQLKWTLVTLLKSSRCFDVMLATDQQESLCNMFGCYQDYSGQAASCYVLCSTVNGFEPTGLNQKTF